MPYRLSHHLHCPKRSGPCAIVTGFEVHWNTLKGDVWNFEQKAGFPAVLQYRLGLCFDDEPVVDPDLCDVLAT